jgi:hypothetical protein
MAAAIPGSEVCDNRSAGRSVDTSTIFTFTESDCLVTLQVNATSAAATGTAKRFRQAQTHRFRSVSIAVAPRVDVSSRLTPVHVTSQRAMPGSRCAASVWRTAEKMSDGPTVCAHRRVRCPIEAGDFTRSLSRTSRS